MDRAHQPPETRCAAKTRTAGGRRALTAAANAAPSGSPANEAGSHSARRAMTAGAACTPRSVRDDRVHPTLAGRPAFEGMMAPAATRARSSTFSTGSAAAGACAGGCHCNPERGGGCGRRRGPDTRGSRLHPSRLPTSKLGADVTDVEGELALGQLGRRRRRAVAVACRRARARRPAPARGAQAAPGAGPQEEPHWGARPLRCAPCPSSLRRPWPRSPTSPARATGAPSSPGWRRPRPRRPPNDGRRAGRRKRSPRRGGSRR